VSGETTACRAIPRSPLGCSKAAADTPDQKDTVVVERRELQQLTGGADDRSATGPRPSARLHSCPAAPPGPSPTYVLRVRLQGRKMVVTMGIVLRAKEVPLATADVQHEWTAPYEEDSLAPHVSHSGYESARICARTKSMISPSLRVVPRRTAEAKAAGPSRSRRLSTRAPIRCASAASNGKAYAEPAAVSAPWSVAAARSARS